MSMTLTDLLKFWKPKLEEKKQRQNEEIHEISDMLSFIVSVFKNKYYGYEFRSIYDEGVQYIHLIEMYKDIDDNLQKKVIELDYNDVLHLYQLAKTVKDTGQGKFYERKL